MNLPMVFIKTYSCFKFIDNGSQEVNGNTLLPNKTLHPYYYSYLDTNFVNTLKLH